MKLSVLKKRSKKEKETPSSSVHYEKSAQIAPLGGLDSFASNYAEQLCRNFGIDYTIQNDMDDTWNSSDLTKVISP